MEDLIDAFPGELTPDMEGVVPTDDVYVEPDLATFAAQTGDLSGYLDLDTLAKIGSRCVADYERDKSDRKEWAKIAEEALKLASQETRGETKTYPWKGASNVRYPLLTTAALQFNARSYPAIVKGDEAISCKVVGQDRGRPAMQPGPNGQPIPIMVPAVGPDGMIAAGPDGQPAMEPQWIVPPGGKAARAMRVAEYMNTVLFYRMEDWESDTDSLLMQLPIVGCAFRKVWFDPITRQNKAVLVSALRIIVPEGARSCETTPRLTEEIPDVYPHEINEKMRSGFYREVVLTDEANEDNARLLLEQQRLIDLDGDGLEEPYIVTVDHTTQRVLRIEANYGPADIVTDEAGNAIRIKRGRYYVKYGFFPHPEGKFYDIGLGHLLAQLGDVVDTAINQLVDAGTAATAGGGFIASGVRLQARGGGSTVRFEPGVYKTVDVPGAVLRDAIVDRTLPQVSPVTFQVLDLILGAAKDIAGSKDVLSGEASNTGQVGTTLALIEQGLQVFNAVYKRIFRALKVEFGMIYDNLAKFGGDTAAQDYAEVMDDPEADFARDFNSKDLDIRPVSDPSSVTRMQKAAKAQFLMSTIQVPGANPVAILKRVYEAFDVENAEELIVPPQPPQPNPKDVAAAAKTQAEIPKIQADTANAGLDAERKKFELERDAYMTGMQLGGGVAPVA